jgi:hypothetical protein
MTADAFAKAHGVGRRQVRLLDELQTELRELLARDDSLAGDQATDDETVDIDASSAGAGAEEGPRPLDDQPIDAIWDVWSQLPGLLRNCLRINGITTVHDVLTMEPADFAALRGVGTKRVQAFMELREALRSRRLQQGIDAAHEFASAGADATPALDTPVHTIEGVAATWPSLEMLLRDVARRVSANRGYTADWERNHEIWLSYHGLGQPGKRTLDAIGAVHGLTRERVRQIVNKLNRLVAGEIERSAALGPFRTALRHAMAQCLGIARTEDLARLLQEQMGWEQQPSPETLQVLADILAHTSLRFNLRRREGVVEHPEACEALRERVAEKIEARLQEIHESEHILDFVHHVTWACRNGTCHRSRSTSQVPCCGGEHGETNLPCEYVKAVLAQIKPCPLDGDRVWGHWWTRLRLPRPKKDVVRAALHILGRPVHYSELTEFICKHNEAFSQADERYVHSLLVLGSEYVLTGELGTYGLREWGVEEYLTVGDRIEQLLREHGAPLPQETIIRRLKEMAINENNIRAALMQQRFRRGLHGHVELTEWATETETARALASSSPGPLLMGDDEDTGYIL